MRKPVIRWIALALAAVLWVGAVPGAVYASEENAPQPYDFSFTGTLVDGDVDQVCYYTDSYFLKDAREYDSQLATMSLCFELTTFSRSDTTGAVWTDQVDEDSNSRVQNAYDLLTSLGFDHFTANEFWAEAPTKDSIGAVAADKRLSDGSTLIALGIRGGGYGQEWASNFTVASAGEHQGFAEARDHVLRFLSGYIGENRITGRIKLWVVGYSRAGCVANMVAGTLNGGYPLGPVVLRQQDLFAYCFAPAMGSLTELTGQADHSNIHNLINLNDLVPLLAPACWGFSRYSTDHWLPSAATTDQFEAMKNRMLSYFAEFGNADSDGDGQPDYAITEYGTQYRLVAHWENLLDPEESVIALEGYDVPTAQILANGVDFLCEDAIGDRETYYYDFQAGMRTLFALISGGSVDDLLSDGMSPGEFLRRFLSAMTPQRIIEILSPMIDPGIVLISERYRRTEENLNHAVKDILGDSELWGTGLFVAELPMLLTETLWRIFRSVAQDLLEQDTDSLQALVNLVSLLEDGGLLQAHLPEIMLSWLMSLDSNYGDGQYDLSASMTRVVRVNGEADVDVVRTDTGELAAAFVDGAAQQIANSSIVAYRNGDGEMILLLPPDGDYTLSIRLNQPGSVGYTVEEYRLDTQENLRILWFGENRGETGDVLTAHVPALSKAELVSQLPEGSDADYTLHAADGSRINPHTQLTGENAGEAVYTVGVYSNNSNGTISGGGSYSLGSYAQVTAQASEDAVFQGWYLNGRRVSEAPVYRFPVTGHMRLFARFSGNQATYAVHFSAGEGGSVQNQDVRLAAGTQLEIVAVADEGYAFDHWEADGGVIQDPANARTRFTVPNADVQVKAVFRVREPDHVHNLEYIPGILPTCTAEGRTEGTRCADCGQILEEPEPLAALGHDFQNGRCSRCGEAERLTDNPFTDVRNGDYFHDSVLWALERGITAGVSADAFGPHLGCTRAQVITFLWRAAGSPAPEGTESPFVDVDRSNYYHDAALWAAEQGITAGVSGNRFAPEMRCTRAQVITFLWRAAGSPAPEGTETPFVDVDRSEYYHDAVLWASEQGIAAGVTGEQFVPDLVCTRAQAVTFLYRAK